MELSCSQKRMYAILLVSAKWDVLCAIPLGFFVVV